MARIVQGTAAEPCRCEVRRAAPDWNDVQIRDRLGDRDDIARLHGNQTLRSLGVPLAAQAAGESDDD